MALSIGVVTVSAVAAYKWGAKAVGKSIRVSLQEFIPLITGCRCVVGRVDVSLRGRVSVSDLTLMNPHSNVEWSNEALLTIERVVADVDVRRMIRTNYQEIVINEITIRGLQAGYENDGSREGSNTFQVYQHILRVLPVARDNHQKRKQETGEVHTPSPDLQGQTTLLLRKVDIEHIRLDLIGPVSHKLGTTGEHVVLGDLCFEDFTAASGLELAETVAHFFAYMMCRSCLYQVTGKEEYQFGDLSRALAHYTTAGTVKLSGGFRQTLGSFFVLQ
jgi:hypothetical protein